MIQGGYRLQFPTYRIGRCFDEEQWAPQWKQLLIDVEVSFVIGTMGQNILQNNSELQF